MAKPQVHHLGLLKRIARYLLQAPRVVQKFKWQFGWSVATGHSDSDWAEICLAENPPAEAPVA